MSTSKDSDTFLIMKHIRLSLIALTILSLCPTLFGQSKGQMPTSQEIELSRAYLQTEISHRLAEGSLTTATAEMYEEQYESLLASPLDVQRLNLSDLLSIPFVGEYEAYQFINYRSRQGEIQDLSELKMIPSWTDELVSYLLPLLRMEVANSEDKAKWNALLEGGKSRLSLIAKRPLNQKPKDEYIGSPEALSLRYRYQSAGHLSAFLGADKDSYEPWHYQRHRGFDSYHGHLALSRLSIINKLIVGDYRASWSEGLVMRQGFWGRSLFANRGGRLQELRPVSGTSEYGFSRGIAADIRLSQGLSLLGLVSSRRIDGRITEGETEELLTALQEGGLHRSARDWERRHSVTARHYGVGLAYTSGRLSLSLQGLYYDWAGRKLKHALGASYNEALEGIKAHHNISLGYRYSSRRGSVALSGEVAQNKKSALATSHHLRLSGESWGEAHIALRYISKDYWAYLGQADTHYQRPNNEVGIALGYQPQAFWRIKLQAEGEWYRSLAERRAKQVEEGALLRLRAERPIGKGLSLGLMSSYRYSKTSYDRWAGSAYLHYMQRKWAFRLRSDLTKPIAETALPLAYTLSTELRYNDNIWRAWGSLAYHEVGDWRGRIYYNMPRLSEEYTMHWLYGRGIVASLGAGRSFGRVLKLSGRMAYTSSDKLSTRGLSLSLQAVFTP